MSPAPQQAYSERYAPLRLVARGGMAEVWEAHDDLLDRTVALKVLFPELSTDPNFVERFRREAQAAANLSHPNIVSVYDWGESGGTYFIVMEFVNGRPLSALLREEGPLLADRAAAIGADVAGALGFAHRNGVVHRDVKPGNVLITSDDHVKVTDFGIARALNTSDNLTQTGAVMGTATYFSPEQAQGAAVDQRSDVYSLGVVLYEMVTGRPPFTADTPVATAYKHVHEEPVPPRSVVPELPAAFEAIVLQALAKDTSHRYATAEELRADLLRFRQGRPVLAEPPPSRSARGSSAVPPAPAAAPQPAAPTTRARPAAPLPAPPPPSAPSPSPPDADDDSPRSLWIYGVLLALLLAALILVVVLLVRQLDLFGNTTGGAASQATIPADVIGKSYNDAVAELRQLGIGNVSRKDIVDASHPAESVTATNPPPGQKIPVSTSVELDVASGPPLVTEPDVVGETFSAAAQRLQAAGFRVAGPVSKDSDTVSPGVVMSQDPPAGNQGHQGDTVTLTVSDGKGGTLVPDETGKDTSTAEADLQAAGFGFYIASHENSTSIPSGSVVRTTPPAGSAVNKGSRVGLVISSGPAKVHVPYVKGDPESAARQAIEGRGLVVAETTQAVTDSSENGVVIDESPAGGTLVDQGSTVNLVIGQYSASTTTTTRLGL